MLTFHLPSNLLPLLSDENTIAAYDKDNSECMRLESELNDAESSIAKSHVEIRHAARELTNVLSAHERETVVLTDMKTKLRASKSDLGLRTVRRRKYQARVNARPSVLELHGAPLPPSPRRALVTIKSPMQSSCYELAEKVDDLKRQTAAMPQVLTRLKARIREKQVAIEVAATESAQLNTGICKLRTELASMGTARSERNRAHAAKLKVLKGRLSELQERQGSRQLI